MAKSDKHINWLNFGCFNGSCMFICGFDFNTVKKILKRKKTTEGWIKAFDSTKDMWDNGNIGFASKRTGIDGKIYFFLVLKKQFDFSDYSFTVLAHEVIHLVSFNLQDLLDPMQENEAFAYTHTFLMNQCLDILRNKK